MVETIVATPLILALKPFSAKKYDRLKNKYRSRFRAFTMSSTNSQS